MYDGFTVMVVTMRPLAGFNMTQEPVRQCTSAAGSTNHPLIAEKWQQRFVFRQRLANGRNDPKRLKLFHDPVGACAHKGLGKTF